MINLTPLLRPAFSREIGRMARYATPEGAEDVQRRVLRSLLRRGADTSFGSRYGFASLGSRADFVSAVPVASYPDMRPWVERMLRGEADVLWPGVCRRFAQSSGTSDGKSKYIPLTSDALRLNHYAGASAAVAVYLNLYPSSRLFGGKCLILGGSYANEVVNLPKGVKVGDLSAHLIDCINPAVNLLRVPSAHIALMPDWERKLPALVEAAIRADVTNISGVPSWFLTVIRHILERTGASTIHDVWPRLEVFFHGGIAFGPYRDQYAAVTDPSRMRYLENYNASEGYFAVQDTAEPGAMRLLLDKGVFFEFLPLTANGPDPSRALGAWEVEPGTTYALVISSCTGLWRYLIGDTVTVRSVSPLRISVAGRTRSFINAFGEEVMVHNTDAALAAACHATGAAVADYTVAPVMADGRRHGRHQWLVEWSAAPPSPAAFARLLDSELQKVNSDYQAKRAGDIFLDNLEIISLPRGTFDRWLASTGKLGGQRKVPRLSNDRHIADAILALVARDADSPNHQSDY